MPFDPRDPKQFEQLKARAQREVEYRRRWPWRGMVTLDEREGPEYEEMLLAIPPLIAEIERLRSELERAQAKARAGMPTWPPTR